MPTAVLFCSDPLSQRGVDSYFQGQADAARAAGATVAVIDHDALLRGQTAQAVRIAAGYRAMLVPRLDDPHRPVCRT